MPRPVIAAIAAALIAALSGASYVFTTSRLESEIRRDLRDRVANAQDLLLRNAELEGLALLARAEQLARDPRMVAAVGGDVANPAPAERAFRELRAGLEPDQRPDILALTDASGRLIALFTGDKRVSNPISTAYLEDGAIEYPALALALSDQQLRIADVWSYETHGPMKVAVAPVIGAGARDTLGAVLVAYGISGEQVARERRLLGTDVAYYVGDTVRASSFAGELPAAVFAPGGVAATALASDNGIAEVIAIDVGGREYVATAGRLPLFSNLGHRPPGYPPPRAGTVVAISVDGALAALAPIKLAIALIGLGAIVVVLLAMFLTARQILAPIDELEVGVADMLDGNLDRTFRPSGSDVDGLANALNVLLARLLGRPEPGEEEYDSEGNLIQPSVSMQISTEDVSAAEAESLAQEPEDEYYARLYAEYTAAVKKSGGSTAGLTEEAFINKLRLHEITLREKYEAVEVRFVVASERGAVTLKPAPRYS